MYERREDRGKSTLLRAPSHSHGETEEPTGYRPCRYIQVCAEDQPAPDGKQGVSLSSHSASPIHSLPSRLHVTHKHVKRRPTNPSTTFLLESTCELYTLIYRPIGLCPTLLTGALRPECAVV